MTIVELIGRLTLGDATSALRLKMRELAASGADRILLDMDGVTFIDSSGIGELVAAHAAVTASGGEIKLLNLTKRAHDLFKITRLCTVFETFSDEAVAVSSFPLPAPTELQLRWARFWSRIASSSLRVRNATGPRPDLDEKRTLPRVQNLYR